MRGYMDESNLNRGRYRAISLVSLPTSFFSIIESKLDKAVCKSVGGELKWVHIRQQRHVLAAQRLLDVALSAAEYGRLRIDTLWWDAHEIRMSRRDKLAKAEKLTHNLLRRVCSDRWEGPTIWKIFPDEGSDIDWSRTGDRSSRYQGSWGSSYLIDDVTPLKSHLSRFIQLADLFAGMATFAPDIAEDTSPNQTCALRHRIPVYEHLFDHLASMGCRPRLTLGSGMETVNRNAPINFWRYRDRAQVEAKLRKRSAILGNTRVA